MPLPPLIRIRLWNLGDTLPDGRKATGKEPRDRAWQRSTTDTPPEPGANWGYLPGPSGLGVLDVEPAGLALFPRPEGVLTIDTPSMAYHLPALLPALEAILGPLRKKLKLGNKAELHTFGSQVLGPGSRAWSDKAGREGAYVLHDGPLWVPTAEFLAPFLAMLTKTVRRAGGVVAHRTSGTTSRARAAFSREVALSTNAPPQDSHRQLHLSACNLGQLVAVGELEEPEVRAGLEGAARHRELPHQIAEAMKAIDDGIAWGKANPREDPPRIETFQSVSITLVHDAIEVAPESDAIPDHIPEHVTRTVLVPGTHKDCLDQYHEQSNQGFAAQVLAALPVGLFYRRDKIPGQVVGSHFVPSSETTFRRLLSEPHVRLARWMRVKDDEGIRQVQQTVQCGPGEAALALDAATQVVPEIKLLTGYPVLLPDRTIARPGFNDGGVYYAGPPIEPERDPDAIRAHLFDLIVDFPFEHDSSRANCVGMLLTPMLRQLVGKVPLHLVTSPMAGTGKTRLVEQIFGISYLDEELSSSQLPEQPEDRAKWLIALLIGGDTLVHLDNLTPELDSANLASLLTSARVSDRLLGSSTFLRLENQLTIAATGNNTQLSSELARRTIIVRLTHPDPEHRTGWKHPDSAAYARTQRQRTLACLAGLALLADVTWTGQALGSFEAWSMAVGSALRAVGIDGHLGNRARWREESDSEDSPLAALVAAWAREHGHQPVTASMLMTLPEASQAADGVARLGRVLARIRDRRFQIETGMWATVVRGGWTVTRRPAYYLCIAGSYPRIAGTDVTTREDVTIEVIKH